MRIVSLVPSLSELVAALGLENTLVACTHFCVHPRSLHRKVRRVGGTKDPDLAEIAALAPSHILVNSEENRLPDIAALRALAPVCETFPKDPADVPAMVSEIAHFLGVDEAGSALAQAVQTELQRLAEASVQPNAWAGKRFLYYIWARPWMLAAGDTYISKLLEWAGLINAAASRERYPVVTAAEAAKLRPELLFFSSEPWPFKRRDWDALAAEWPNAPPPFWIDGRLMSWHGYATLKVLQELQAWLAGEETRLVRPLVGLASSVGIAARS